jgi:AcrR family transcriptional regulator
MVRARMAKAAPQMPAKLAASAFRLFARGGIANVSLDQVAAAAGVTKGSLYWHFKNKDEVIKAAATHYYQAYHRRMHAAIAPLSDPMERLRRVLQLSVRICLLDAENRVFTMDIWTLAVHDAEIRRSWRQFYDSVREFYIGLVRAAAHAGRLQTDDPVRAVNLMLEAIEGIKLRALFEPQICAPDEETEIVRSLLKMLGCDTEAATAA